MLPNKRKLSVLVLLFFTLGMHSQEQEFENFKKEFNFYIDFTIGKFDSLPVNQANQTKFTKKVDEAFKQFVLHPKSHEYEKLVIAKGVENTKLIRLDGRGEITITTFNTNNKTYIVYGYTSQPKKNYVIKDVENNKIVYEGNTNNYVIDGIYAIDATHFLLVQRDGDYHTSRSAVVLLLTEKQTWKQTQSFSGMAFGQVPGDYFNKKFVKKRTYFQLECEIDFTMNKPSDINKITFDANTKTISYKQYYETKKPVIITAKWENNLFTIDDYNVNENLRENSLAVPR